jgi:glycosyltransferase involved in cell wall biosynthesis
LGSSSETSPSPRHVVHVIGSLQTGGAEKMVVNFLQAVDRTEFRHSVLCLQDPGVMAPEVEAAGVPVKVLPVRFRSLWRDLSRLVAYFRTEKAAIVHSHMYWATVWSRLAALRAGVPVLVTTEHGKELWKNRFQNALGHWLSKRTFKHICVSHDVLDLRTRRQGLLADRSLVVPNGVPLPDADEGGQVRAARRAELGLDDSRLVIGTVGRVVEAKDYPTLLKALVLAVEREPRLHWLQVGDGPDLPALREMAAGLGVADHVTFAGRRSDITDLLRSMDLWVMSSVREGLPVSLLEAMAARRPIVATSVGGIPDAVAHGESALLVPPGDPEALVEAILRLAGDRILAERLVENAHARVVGHYSIDAVAATITGIYREGLAEVRD